MPFETIVIGVDGSRGGESATHLGGEMAATMGAHVLLVHAVPLPPLVVGVDQAISAESAAYLEKTGKQVVGAAAALLDEMGVEHEQVIKPGAPADLILDTAEQHRAGLIVVGHRGLGAVRRFILGSVSSKLAHHARCAVLLAPVTDEE